MNAPPGEFRSLNVVGIGSFNPKILHPAWLTRYKLVTEEEFKLSKVHAVSEQVAHFEIQDVTIQCVSNRLTIATENAARFDMLQDLIVGIFELLPHTPITAIGINPAAHFPARSSDAWHKVGNSLAPKEGVWNDLYENPGMQSLSILSQRSGDYSGPMRVTVEPSVKVANGVFVGINAHYDIPAGQGMDSVLGFIVAHWKSSCLEVDRVAAKIFEKLLP